MDYNELKELTFSIIGDDDPYKASKQLQIKNWCGAFLDLFDSWGETKLPFFLDVLSDEECWEKADTIHGLKLNRRIAAKKMVGPQSWKGKSNPLDDFDRYQLACWCCLEDDIVALFDRFKQEDRIKDTDTASLRELVKSVSGSYYTDPMMEYWSHVVSGYASELKLKGKHLYVCGLDRALGMRRVRVEAVEFFWNKVKFLPEGELSAWQKDEIFMNAAVRATGSYCSVYPEVFEFCFSQINPNRYLEFLKRDFARNGRYDSLYTLKDGCSFDNLKALFDCLQPGDISEHNYYTLLRSIKVKNYLEHYASVGAELVIHMWMKEGFNDHRFFTLYQEMTDPLSRGEILGSLVSKGYMEPVLALLDRTSSDQIREFMSSRQVGYICSLLKKRGDEDSLDKFLSYSRPVAEGCETDLTEVELSKLYDLRACP